MQRFQIRGGKRNRGKVEGKRAKLMISQSVSQSVVSNPGWRIATPPSDAKPGGSSGQLTMQAHSHSKYTS